MTEFPYMQLYVSDYLADTPHLSGMEHGAYLLLLMNYWQRGELPNHDRKLARIARVTDEEWSRIRDTILEFFTVHPDRLTHKRIDNDLEAARKKVDQAAQAGKASGEARRRSTGVQPKESKPSTTVEPNRNEPATNDQPPLNDRSTTDERETNDRSTDVQRTMNHSDSYSDPESNPDPIPTPPKPPTGGAECVETVYLRKPIPRIGPKLSELIREWNAAGLPEETRLPANIPDAGTAATALAAWTPDQVTEALQNFSGLIRDREQYRRIWPEYLSPSKFAAGGIAQYLTKANPWSRCGRITPATSEESKEEVMARFLAGEGETA